MSLCGLLRNRTGNDSAGFGVKSRLRLAVTKGTRIDIGAISLTACTSDERLLGRPEAIHDVRKSGLNGSPRAMTAKANPLPMR